MHSPVQTLAREHYLAGMPQLAYSGLSENWLLKQCGHRHWLALAALNDKRVPEFVDADGNKSYAAFTAVRITSAQLANVGENQRFMIDSQLVRAGQARHYSVHHIGLPAMNSNADNANSRHTKIQHSKIQHSNTEPKQAADVVAKIEMLSTFVYRQESGNNQSVKRASFAYPNALPLAMQPHAELEAEAQSLISLCKSMRSGDWHEHMGLSKSAKAQINELSFLPCPNNDFNGANFLYFASFQAFVDRAEWAWFCLHDLPAIADRDIFFYGNINIGDTLHIRLCAEIIELRKLAYWCEISNGNGQKIADVFTHKRRGNHAV